jgi:pyruvate-formate lyase-activating enzyme
MRVLAESRVDPTAYFAFLKTQPQYESAVKRENLARLLAARSAGALCVAAAPAYIRFEPSAYCNLRCCWAQRQPAHPALRPRGNADPELARRIVAEIGDSLYMAILCHWGEPTLNPRLPEMVRAFHDAGIYTTLDTNMTRMTAGLAAELSAAGLDAISASIDGVSQGVYGQYRKGGNVGQALDGLRHVLAGRRRLGRANPRLRWQYLVFPHNEHEVDEAQRLAAEIGVDAFEAFAGSGGCWSRAAGFQPARPPVRPAGLLCNDPWTYLAVDWDGAAHVCCRAFQAQHVVGHMDDQSLPELFDGRGFQLARRVIRDGVWTPADGPTPCTGCNRVTHFTPAIAALAHSLTLEESP